MRSNLKRNYAAHYLHGMLGMTGFRLVNAPTFMPAYLHALSGSKTMVGLGLALGALGSVFAPIVGASHIEHRKRVLPVAVVMGLLMRVQILGLGLAGWFLAGKPLLVAILCFLFLLGLFTGAQRVAFQLLLGKVIPVHMRGRLQAWRNVTGGLIAAGLSYLAGRYLVGANLFGNGYGSTFLLAFVLTSLGLTALNVLMREPEPPTVRPQMQLGKRLREFPELLRSTPGLSQFLIAQVFAVAGRIATPFYILYASKSIAITGANLGLLSLAYLGADTVANLIWGYAGDRIGFRAILIAALSVWVCSTLLLLNAAGFVPLFLAFCGLGAAQSGYLMSVTTMVLEFGSREDMAMRLALSTTAEGVMAAAGPLLGGVIASGLGYTVLFGSSIGCQIAALILLFWLVEEPRKRRLQASSPRP
ncbi:MAG TPA: MFS transporter [Polyangiales bacterium]|nr:MFS transporter [Polyangiales bacterium]